MARPPVHADRAEVLRRLGEAVRRVEERAVEARPGRARPAGTGWPGADAALPGGGLAFGAVHEWLGLAPTDGGAAPARPEWTPPLLVLAHLAACVSRLDDGPPRRTVWVGRRVWPTGDALARSGLLEWAVLLDPPDSGSRAWATDAALRCPGIVVVADGSGATTASTRRFQLAAESGGALGLLARPPAESKRISAAFTRWVVARRAGERLGWRIALLRCRGAPAAPGLAWETEFVDDRVVALPADVPDRRGAAAAAS